MDWRLCAIVLLLVALAVLMCMAPRTMAAVVAGMHGGDIHDVSKSRVENAGATCEYHIDDGNIIVDKLIFNDQQRGSDALKKLSELHPDAKIVVPTTTFRLHGFLTDEGFRYERVPVFDLVYSRTIVRNPHAFYIAGMPGCGKTTLGRKLVDLGVKMYDGDELNMQITREMQSDPEYMRAISNGDTEYADGIIGNRFTQELNRIISNGPVVFVGVQAVRRPQFDIHKIALKIPPEQNFRGQFARFVDRVCAKRDVAMGIIESAPIAKVLDELQELGVHPFINLYWNSFLNSYNSYYNRVQQAGDFRIMTPDEAYEFARGVLASGKK